MRKALFPLALLASALTLTAQADTIDDFVIAGRLTGMADRHSIAQHGPGEVLPCEVLPCEVFPCQVLPS